MPLFARAVKRVNVEPGQSLGFAALIFLSVSGVLLGGEAQPEAPLSAVFFFTPGCRMCGEAREAVRAEAAEFGSRLRMEWADLSNPKTGTATAQRLFAMLDAYGVKETPEIAVFVGKTCLAGPEAVVEKLRATVQTELARPPTERGFLPVAGYETPGLREESNRSVQAESAVPDLSFTSHRLGLWAISAAALADGVNPCAFATVVLLVSMLATAHRTKRETLLVGFAFTLAVYLTYFLIGLCLFSVLQRLSGFRIVSDLVFDGAFGLCVVAGLISLYDAVTTWRSAAPKGMILKLPESLRERIRWAMSAGVRGRSLIAGAFGAGVIVSLLESACTGQAYFPVIAGLARESATRMRGIGLLLWYNLLFILPLVGVFGAVFFGVTNAKLSAFSRNHVSLAKLALALVFFLMALWLFPALTWPGRH